MAATVSDFFIRIYPEGDVLFHRTSHDSSKPQQVTRSDGAVASEATHAEMVIDHSIGSAVELAGARTIAKTTIR
jgi:hypothetical protein